MTDTHDKTGGPAFLAIVWKHYGFWRGVVSVIMSAFWTYAAVSSFYEKNEPSIPMMIFQIMGGWFLGLLFAKIISAEFLSPELERVK